ncbi:site-specific integrase [Methylocystis sp. WRRC1]|uniref:tyrosine-type recombinase/integrase n=1 Tax=Methylocystis sp. WRRC1 TaxID=1732014 RepID=UPI001D139120|nr:tyrosine-type recombinase/integrase [Methylocystis sp. WRRC1]MCC3245212.1 site-specific integrase [Methylocystis sp. WRRC1]
MAGPLRHLLYRNGRYYARVAVSEPLRPYVGKRELLKALGPDRKEAQRLLPGVVARFLDQLAEAKRRAARDGQPSPKPSRRPLSQAALAHLLYQELLAVDDESRNVSSDRTGVTMPDLNKLFASERAMILRKIVSGAASDDEIAANVGAWIETFRERGYVDAPPASRQWRELARMFASVHIEALSRSTERDDGDYSGKTAFPLLTGQAPHETSADAAPLWDLFNDYIADLKASGGGRVAERRWRPVFDNLIEFLGHDDAARITRADMRNWRRKLQSKLAPRTIKNVYFAAVKTVLNWAVNEDRLSANPLAGMTFRRDKEVVTREKGFSDAEAIAILKAARDYEPRRYSRKGTIRESPQTTAAKRWIAWLAAFSGARVGELAQLRKEDVRRDGDIVYIRLTPEAGSIKTDEFRDVPLHDQVLELGFLRFVDAAPDGPLFYSLVESRKSKTPPAEKAAKAVREWIREIGVISAGVQPNHGWRHRLKTIGRELGVDISTLDAFQGHAARTAGETYGHFSLKAKKRIIEQFPRYEA